MTVADGFTRVVQSIPLFAAVCVAAVPLILLRLFGVLFFASTTSMWAIVPALTLGALLVVAAHSPARRGVFATALLGAYLCSFLFHGWSDMKLRLDEGQSNLLDVLEAGLILVLVLRCLTSRAEHRRRLI